jgi:hypothetical protein
MPAQIRCCQSIPAMPKFAPMRSSLTPAPRRARQGLLVAFAEMLAAWRRQSK